jgi:uncharacterized protein (TIGR00251 family)
MSQCRRLKHEFYEWNETTLILNVLGTPAAKKTAIGKPLAHQLKISVTASPTNGGATDFMVAYLAKVFKVRIKDIDVVFGRTSIHKQLKIHQPQQLPPMIEWPEKNAPQVRFNTH